MSDLARRFQDFYNASSDEERAILATAALALEALACRDEAEVTGFFFDEADALFGKAVGSTRYGGHRVQDLLPRLPAATRVFTAPLSTE